MSFNPSGKVLRRNMSAVAAAIGRIPHARISIASRINVSPRTVDNWLDQTTEPSASNLIALMREFEVVTTEVLKLAGKRTLTDSQMLAARQALQILAGAGDDAPP